jgi:hypothetical protein
MLDTPTLIMFGKTEVCSHLLVPSSHHRRVQSVSGKRNLGQAHLQHLCQTRSREVVENDFSRFNAADLVWCKARKQCQYLGGKLATLTHGL